MSSPDLDNPQVYKQFDTEDMLARLHEVPRICQQAWQMAMKFDLPQEYAEVNKVVILGMGGSAIGGDFIISLALPEAKLPVFVHRDYHLPAFVDAKTLVIASSYSGMTEETLSSFEQALATDSKKLTITTDGKLKAMAEENNVPVFSFDYEAQPRTALPFTFLPVLCFLQKLGFLSEKSVDVAEAIEFLQGLPTKINDGVPLTDNPAKQLAQRLYGHLPVIYGAGILSGVAHRWKTLINENSKAWAFYEVFPELNHNAVVGYQFPAELTDKIIVVLLRSAYLDNHIQLRYQLTAQLLNRARISHYFVVGEGTSPLSQMMSLVLLGDYVSYYLAILYKIDPSPVKAIDCLKEQLGKNRAE